MEYERIHQPFFPQGGGGGGGFSPKKLREKLLRVEKRRNEELEQESKASLRSEHTEVESGRASEAGSCKDVECSISMEFTGSHGRRDLAIGAWRIDSLESDGVATGFQFQKAERTPHRLTMGTATLAPPFSKPAPSKWDDAQKWIARPTPNRGGGGGQAKKGGLAGYITREVAAKVVLDEAETKRVAVSVSHAKKEVESGAKPAVVFENPVINADADPSRHDLSASARSTTTIFVTPATAVRAVSMRDMGTEMTPAVSQEPSRTETPIRATSPSTGPPFPHRSTAQRTAPCSTTQTHSSAGNEEQSIQQMSEKEQRRKTRREIMVLGQQLGKTNIAAWAGKEEEEMMDASAVLAISVPKDHPAESATEARAVAWEEAKKTKHFVRFKLEEIKIAAWEDRQKATIEAEMRKVEAEVEITRASAHERLMNQLAAVRHKAEAKRAEAEAKRDQQAVKNTRRADYIRRTGQIPSRFPCRSWYSLRRFLWSKDSIRSESNEKILK
ncbi:uncharacterized protein LOC122025139 [Zingiber officinale]|uniref:Remorin C-terminal domain-containing protein n=1 Tax=Zingiber officinale TaxID=94328 RepID=A0A8J5K912_ZINOF|nr:uncharacterized protein LOC122025139 [Zingiber officinale]KAG6476520.1 hypothetical protein ZIOFF_065762 [Zingiber officinale]